MIPVIVSPGFFLLKIIQNHKLFPEYFSWQSPN